jgi:hypothetical protein
MKSDAMIAVELTAHELSDLIEICRERLFALEALLADFLSQQEEQSP